MNVLTSILPVFGMILLGWASRRRGFMPESFIEPANRLVYYLAIPAMIFRSVSQASLTSQLDARVLAVTLGAVPLCLGAAWLSARYRSMPPARTATYLQSTFHGNLGYIGLAVAFYALGNDGFVRAGLIAGFLMILQNFLAVVVLQSYAFAASGGGGGKGAGLRRLVLRIVAHPVILSAFFGLLVSGFGLRMPAVLDRMLDILGSLALPMALLIIGATLSFHAMRDQFVDVGMNAVMKLVLLPAIGWVAFRTLGIGADAFSPALVLMASPTATLTYVMAREMGGDKDFAVSVISVSTVLSAITYSIWLHAAG
ncbi:MAG: AEC family transporter [Desulfobacteraceae bacterium]|jgi:predicted permease|nr:AEC family transporter [Desulfobacteraceae bacterium]